jgi:hypothetical protein
MYLIMAFYDDISGTFICIFVCEISGSYGGRYEEDNLMSYSAV